MSPWRLFAMGAAVMLAVITGLTLAFAVTITDFVENPSWGTLVVAALPALLFGIPGGLAAAIVIVGSRIPRLRRNEKTPPPD